MATAAVISPHPHAVFAKTRLTARVNVVRHALRLPRRARLDTTPLVTRARAKGENDNDASSITLASYGEPLPPHLVTPTQLFDTEYARDDPKKLAEVKIIMESWADDVEQGVLDEVTVRFSSWKGSLTRVSLQHTNLTRKFFFFDPSHRKKKPSFFTVLTLQRGSEGERGGRSWDASM